MKRCLLPAALSVATLPAAVQDAIVIGTENRQDDLPSVAAAPDGTVWTAWLGSQANATTS